jgi:hypothetical protein
MARGHRPRGIRDAAPLVIPLLAGGLERAMTLPRPSRRGPSSTACARADPHPWQLRHSWAVLLPR